MIRRLLATLLTGTLLVHSAGIAAAGLPAVSGGEDCVHELPVAEPVSTAERDNCCPAGTDQSCCQLTCIATPGLAVVPATDSPRHRAATAFSDPSGLSSRAQPPPTRPPISTA